MSTKGTAATPEVDREVATKRLRPIVCPECGASYATPGELAPHLERHSPVLPPRFSKRGMLRSWLCKKGCGRHFPFMTDNFATRPSRPYRRHVEVCDGQAPIPVRPRRRRRFS